MPDGHGGGSGQFIGLVCNHRGVEGSLLLGSWQGRKGFRSSRDDGLALRLVDEIDSEGAALLGELGKHFFAGRDGAMPETEGDGDYEDTLGSGIVGGLEGNCGQKEGEEETHEES